MHPRMPARLVLLLVVGWLRVQAAQPAAPADARLAAYFAAEVERLTTNTLADTALTRGEWEARRETWRRELFDMLGLWPLPERTPLNPVVTGRVEHGDFTVENLHFQALPGLYVTANLYRPPTVERPLPAILYVSGHASVRTNGVSLGNKTGYQHHGEWFARNGYVCLTLDTLQLGEIAGDHHGTYRLGQWWWNSRGYTPAGVEAWFGIRALDYLETRPEVDRERIGMTGRSGGGSYTWTTAALDDRVRVAAPVAGITDLRNQVVDGCIEGHCDCMFFVNTHRWDFARNAALLAPRPLLVVNTDRDSIFPLDGVVRVHRHLAAVYRLLGAEDRLGLVIGPGPHKDTQDLQVPVFRWFNQHLRGEDPPIAMPAAKLLDPAALRVLDRTPAGQRNGVAQEWFGPASVSPGSPVPPDLVERLRERCFAGWPSGDAPSGARLLADARTAGFLWRVHEVWVDPHVTATLVTADPVEAGRVSAVRMEVVDGTGWDGLVGRMGTDLARQLRLIPRPEGTVPDADRLPAADWATAAREPLAWAWLAVRGIGPDAWSGDERRQTMIRRRFQLLGQTLDGMRVRDVVRSLQAGGRIAGIAWRPVTLVGRGRMAPTALLAALHSPSVRRLELGGLPVSFRLTEADYLNILTVTDLPQLLAHVRATLPVEELP